MNEWTPNWGTDSTGICECSQTIVLSVSHHIGCVKLFFSWFCRKGPWEQCPPKPLSFCVLISLPVPFYTCKSMSRECVYGEGDSAFQCTDSHLFCLSLLSPFLPSACCFEVWNFSHKISSGYKPLVSYRGWRKSCCLAMKHGEKKLGSVLYTDFSTDPWFPPDHLLLPSTAFGASGNWHFLAFYRKWACSFSVILLHGHIRFLLCLFY